LGLLTADGSYSGKVKEEASLEGIKNWRSYKFSCIEEIEEVEGTAVNSARSIDRATTRFDWAVNLFDGYLMENRLQGVFDLVVASTAPFFQTGYVCNPA